MGVHIPLFALFLTTAAAGIIGCGESSSSYQGPNPPAYVRVQTTTSTGLLTKVPIHLERRGSVTLTAATGRRGEHMFEVLDATIGERAAVIVEPLTGYRASPPQALSLVPSDTVHVRVVLQPAP
jgi:hypothetical protein